MANCTLARLAMQATSDTNLLQPFGPLAGSDRGGVLDSIASRAAIAAEAATLATKRKAPHLLESVGTDVKNIKSTAVADAIQSGDEDVEELVRNRAQMLGIIPSNMVDFLNPEMIMLGGGLEKQCPTSSRKRSRPVFKSHATPEAQQGLQIVTAKLKNHAVTTGAQNLQSTVRRKCEGGSPPRFSECTIHCDFGGFC